MPAAAPHRTVLVTGAAVRLGRAIALELAAAGWQVAVHYRGSADAALETVAACRAHAPAEAFQADLADEEAARALLPRVVQHFGSVDALVNNAALFENDAVANFSHASFATHMAINTAAPVLLAQALHAHLVQRSAQGAVVNMLDQKLWNPNPDFLSYTLSKAALQSATTLLAQALAPQLRVTGVAPGLTLTSHMLSQEKFEQLHQLSPLGRSSTPDDVARAVRFALENASMTGTTLLVDGGQHLMKFERDFSLM
jgi:NAD(P)-dependent dehydrogenase (short-subunit alcohol dehydrogenase family)